MRQKIVLVLFIILGIYAVSQRADWFFEQENNEQINGGDRISHAFKNRISNLQVEGVGVVIVVLKDDTVGKKHQKFILKLPAGMTVLVAHNLDLAPRIDNLKKGDTVAFSGEYEWNEKGGVVHWTHHDPDGKHADGWLIHNGREYR